MNPQRIESSLYLTLLLSMIFKEVNMDTLGKMKEKVTVLLETYPKLRDDDFLLIGAVCSMELIIQTVSLRS